LTRAIGHPDKRAFGKGVAAAGTYNWKTSLTRKSGLWPAIPRFMKQMVEHVPDAGSYAPVTILIDERPDGVHLSYDRMASSSRPLREWGGTQVAQDLDAKVEALLLTAAR
jgi:hypothetical protein